MSNRLLAPLVILVTALIFLPVCGHQFLGYDDSINITGNPYLERFSLANLLSFWQAPYLKLYIPLTYSLWSILAGISRLIAASPDHSLSPSLFHSANLVLHCATTALVFQLLRRLKAAPMAAAAGALFFALHPLQVEAVAWATGLKDLLAGFFSLLALWQYVTAGQNESQPSKARGHFALALASFVCALLAKPSAVAVPLLTAALGAFELHKTPKRLGLEIVPWLACALPIVLLTRQAQPMAGLEATATIWQRLLVAGDSLTFYLTKIATPLTLGPDYGRTPEAALASPTIYLSGLLPSLLIALLIWKRPRPLFIPASLFLAALLPVIGLIPFNFQQISTVADRYLYLAMLGPALAVAWWLSTVNSPKAYMIFLLAILALSAKTVFQERHWHDSLTLSLHSVAINPDSWFFLNNLGNAYHDAHETAKAVESLNKSIALKPDYEIPYINLGVVFKETGQKERAIASYLKALALNPELPNVHNDLAMVYHDLGNTAQAIEHLNQAIALKPAYANANANLGIVYASANKPEAALAAYQRAVAINPGFAEAYINLGALHKTLGNHKEAIACFEKAIKLLPHRPEAYNNLGLLYLETGRHNEAIPLFTKATKADKKSPIPWDNLGKALLAAGRSSEAIAAIQQAIAIDRGFAPAYNTLAAAYLATGQYRSAVEAADQAKALGLSDPKQLRAVEPYR